ncbi:PstS family phosphate ABC transporter substrate-binding protein [Collimonas silvisoli]|uniref:PstS family phosphate ABC transporter substrate-binding protein n=1 Tax=Collimonas silvisoli TaxID=2825884 RepID=UPI001B8DA9F1|nr:substrate-binding domain-containing protein [Collimonas silvisoli]
MHPLFSTSFTRMAHRLSALLLGLSFASQACAQATDPQPYQPQAVAFPKGASYIAPDGSIYIVGNDGMKDILTRFNTLFAKTHPGFKFTMRLEGSSTALGGLSAGVSAFAPMSRDGWKTELLGFKEVFGYQPTDIHVAYSGYGPREGKKTPPAVYVNTQNPLTGLSTEQVAQIFTAGHSQGDITHWKQLGLDGEWSKRLIHIYGIRDDGGFATALAARHLQGLPFTYRYEALNTYEEVLKAVAADRYGIGITGWVDAAAISKNVRLLPLAKRNGGPYYTPSYANVLAGRYPYSVHVRFYVNRTPGQALDPFVKEYLRMALSKEGQAIIATQKNTSEGYVPLDPSEIAHELSKLE